MRTLTVLAVLILSAAAFAQNGVNCQKLSTPVPTVVLCSVTVDGKTTYYRHELDADRASATQISFDAYIAALKADTEALNAPQTPNPVASDPSAPFQMAMSTAPALPRLAPESIHKKKACENAGYDWQHGTCKVKGGQ